jgi:acyl carrier protein
MHKEAVTAQVLEIVRKEFPEEASSISLASTADDVPGWDSMAHVSLIAEIESVFNVRFNTDQLNDFSNVGSIIDAVDHNIKQAG